MKIAFVEKKGGPENLLAEAELLFDPQGPLCGMKLVGFAIWRGREGGRYITFPSRPYGGTKHFDHLRPQDTFGSEAAKSATEKVKRMILDSFNEWSREPEAQAQDEDVEVPF